MVELHGGNGRVRSPRASRLAAGPRQTWKLLLERLETRALPRFLAPRTFDADRSPACVAVGDVNGDGAFDVVTANIGSNDVSVLFGIATRNPFTGARVPAKVTFRERGNHEEAIHPRCGLGGRRLRAVPSNCFRHAGRVRCGSE